MMKMKKRKMIKVLDKGYVRLVKAHGDDLDIANAARASYVKESEELTEGDIKLIKFLGKRQEGSPFRHVFATLEVKAPLFVARQWWKYVVGSDHTMETAWNEASRRYITMEPEFYVPTEKQWRSAPENSKQGSGAPLDDANGAWTTFELEEVTRECMAGYEQALARGVAPEQARLFLPAYGMYTVWRWTASLQGIGFFLSQRLESNAQEEIREYARAVYELVEPCFPVGLPAFMGVG